MHLSTAPRRSPDVHDYLQQASRGIRRTKSGLTVAFEVERTHPDLTLDGLLEYPCGDPSSLPLDLTRQPDVDRDDPHG